jgi:hypothetical protein
LHFKRADVNPAAFYSFEVRAALIVVRRANEIRITGIDGRATW